MQSVFGCRIYFLSYKNNVIDTLEISDRRVILENLQDTRRRLPFLLNENQLIFYQFSLNLVRLS